MRLGVSTSAFAERTWERPRAAGRLATPMTAALVGASCWLTARLFLAAHTPGMTRGRKEALIADGLPLAIAALFAAAWVALWLAERRRPETRTASTFASSAGRVAALVAVLALSTPLLQRLCGAPVSFEPSGLFDTPADALTALAGLGAAALQEDVLVRWLPVELVLLCAVRRGRAAILVSAVIAAGAHAVTGWSVPTAELLIQSAAPRLPAALVLAWLYLRRGPSEAWCVHALTNLTILLVLPAVL